MSRPRLIRSARSGRWSDPATWEGGRIPGPGTRVQVRAGHVVIYDIETDDPIRSIHVAGTLRFDPDRDTRLDVGLIKIQAGDDPGESGSTARPMRVAPGARSRAGRLWKSARADRPIARDHTALIRLTSVPGLDPENCPAIVCCGGRMDFHGAELSRTWVKLGATAAKGSTDGRPRRAGHRLAGRRPRHRHGDAQAEGARRRQCTRASAPGRETEERTIRAIDGHALDARRPAGIRACRHRRLSRRGRQPEPQRHRRVGRPGRHPRAHDVPPPLVRLDLLCRVSTPGKDRKAGQIQPPFPSGRGHDARSVGGRGLDLGQRQPLDHDPRHQFAGRPRLRRISARSGTASSSRTARRSTTSSTATWRCRPARDRRLPGQVLPFDRNEGAGFWWANSRNAFMRNVAVECDQYGFRYEAPTSPGFDPVLDGPRIGRCRAAGGYPHAAVPSLRGQRSPRPATVWVQPGRWAWHRCRRGRGRCRARTIGIRS